MLGVVLNMKGTFWLDPKIGVWGVPSADGVTVFSSSCGPNDCISPSKLCMYE